VFVISPHGRGSEKAIEVERALLVESARSIKDFEGLLAQLDLPRLLQSRERYDLKACQKVKDSAVTRIRERSTADEGWAKVQTGATLSHGSHDFSGPVLPSPPGAVSSLRAQ
jgi:hypothetical protein